MNLAIRLTCCADSKLGRQHRSNSVSINLYIKYMSYSSRTWMVAVLRMFCWYVNDHSVASIPYLVSLLFDLVH